MISTSQTNLVKIVKSKCKVCSVTNAHHYTMSSMYQVLQINTNTRAFVLWYTLHVGFIHAVHATCNQMICSKWTFKLLSYDILFIMCHFAMCLGVKQHHNVMKLNVTIWVHHVMSIDLLAATPAISRFVNKERDYRPSKSIVAPSWHLIHGSSSVLYDQYLTSRLVIQTTARGHTIHDV